MSQCFSSHDVSKQANEATSKTSNSPAFLGKISSCDSHRFHTDVMPHLEKRKHTLFLTFGEKHTSVLGVKFNSVRGLSGESQHEAPAFQLWMH